MAGMTEHHPKPLAEAAESPDSTASSQKHPVKPAEAGPSSGKA